MLKATDNPQSEPGKPMSAAFEPHMGIFVEAQDKYVISMARMTLTDIYWSYRILADMLAPHRKGKTAKAQPRSSSDGPQGEDDSSTVTTVLPSSTDLFYFYGQSLEQCAKLSTGQALFDLCTLHKKWLRIYAGKAPYFCW